MKEGANPSPKEPVLMFKTEAQVYAAVKKRMQEKIVSCLETTGDLISSALDQRTKRETEERDLKITHAMEDCAYEVTGKLRGMLDEMTEKFMNSLIEVTNNNHPVQSEIIK